MPRVALMLLIALLVPRATLAQNEPPTEAIVWWSFDPTRFEHERDEPAGGAFLPILRAGVGAGLFGNGTEASILEALLAASEVGRAPHTFAVIDFAAQREENNSGMDVERLQAVLELRTGKDHDRFLRTIKRIALDAPKSKHPEADIKAGQARIELPGGRTAVVLRDSNDEPWEQLAWCSEEGVFTIGYGAGALERWFASRPAEEPVWDGHRHVVDAERPEGERVLEAYVNIDALRERFVSAFHTGRTPRMLKALRLERASSVMLHGRFVEQRGAHLPLLAIDHTVMAPHAEGLAERVEWSLDAWPEDLAPLTREDGATYALIAAPDWTSLVDQAIEIHNATITDKRIQKHLESVEAWRADRGASLKRLLGTLGAYLVLSDTPHPPAPIPGLATVLVPLSGDATVAAQAMSGVLTDFQDRVRTKTANGDTRWSYSIDSGGLVRLPVWTVMQRDGYAALVGGWGYACLKSGERWLTRFNDQAETD